MARLARFARASIAATAVLWAAAAVACSKAPDVNSGDGTSESRLADLERMVNELRAENEAAKQALGVSGNERASVASRVADLVEKVRHLEDQLASGAASAAARPDATSAASTGEVTPITPTPGGAITLTPSADGSFTSEQVAALERAMDAVQQKRVEDAEKKRLRDVIANANLSLTADQEALVLRLQRDYTKKRQELFSAMRDTRRGMQSEADRTELRGKLEELQAQHENELRSALPASLADPVVTAMKQSFPGFFRGDRGERNARPTMNGN